MEIINLNQLKKEAKSSWNSAFRGKEFLGQFPEVKEKELPYFTYKEHIQYLENLVVNLADDKFMFPIVSKQLLEAKLVFIFRYEWEFGKTTLPFGHNWIYTEYKKLTSERNILDYLIN